MTASRQFAGDVVRLACFMAISMSIAALSPCAAIGITGRVLDPQGKVVTGATIRIRIGASEVAQATSDDQGRFQILSVSPGVYRLTIEAPGFQNGIEDVKV